MEDLQTQLKDLFDKAEWTLEEKAWILTYLENNEPSELNDLLKQQFDQHLGKSNPIEKTLYDRLLCGIHDKMEVPAKSTKGRTLRMWTVGIAAASVLAAISIFGINKWISNSHRNNIDEVNSTQPGNKTGNSADQEKAVLTLADGLQILVENAPAGLLAKQGTVSIIKVKSGEIAYQSIANNEAGVFNNITIPRGSKYKITLPDGTNVWLNAASSLRFPTTFNSNTRTVELIGEGYFEVAKNPAKPFHVKVPDFKNKLDFMDVQVLGTHFNINAYHDELNIKTTLLEGKVEVSKNKVLKILKPAQQAQLSTTGHISIKPFVDVNSVVAWKDGFFKFDGADLKEVMRQITRWYDVEVSYEGDIPLRQFKGQISRSSKLSEVLAILEATNVHFKMDNKKVLVKP